MPVGRERDGRDRASSGDGGRASHAVVLFPVCVGAGFALGAAFGSALGNVGIGIGVGLVLGALVGLGILAAVGRR